MKINVRGQQVQSVTVSVDVKEIVQQLCALVMNANHMPSDAYVDGQGRIALQVLRTCQTFEQLVYAAARHMA